MINLHTQLPGFAGRSAHKRAALSPMRFVLVFIILALLATEAKAGLPGYVVIDSIVVHKKQRKMCVYQEGEFVKSYRIALGPSPVGRKRYKGDNRTPEGLYYIEDKNPFSDYHKNLGISYPNDNDRARARRNGRSPGGDIKIHGLPNGKGYLGSSHARYDWTEGCIAVTNREIDELYRHVEVGAPINILP
ncbi:MAG: L,D-transpeptidase family protein [Flavipsychrobacter sp.]|nr:L,D-transpeptidase family protein [Flavipsychrobacter sp.]